MSIQLSDHFTCLRLIRFTLPNMGMFIVASVYSIVDGFFVSNYVGKASFVAMNLIFPFIMIPGTLGFMIGTGGNALVSKILGEGDQLRANRIFSLLVYSAAVIGLATGLLCLPFLRPAAQALGAKGEVLEACVTYGSFVVPGIGPMILQFMFQNFFSLAENPHLGLLVTTAAGLTNIVLDALFILLFGWGLAGAAAATLCSLLVGAGLPFWHFARPNKSRLRLGRTRFEWRPLLKACSNGASELLSNVSMAMVAVLFNFQLLRLAGENGVAAYGVGMYVNFISVSILCGYAFGVIPIIGYHFGAQNIAELRGLLRRSLAITSTFGIILTACAVLLARPLARIFVGYDAELLALTEHAASLYALSFMFTGINIFASSFFTALNDGLVSACISFFRTLLFQTAAILILPALFGLNGIWLAVATSEAATLCVALGIFWALRHKYQYC